MRVAVVGIRCGHRRACRADAPLHDEYGALFGLFPRVSSPGLLLPNARSIIEKFCPCRRRPLLHRTIPSARMRTAHGASSSEERCARSRWAKAPRVRRRPLLVHRFRLCQRRRAIVRPRLHRRVFMVETFHVAFVHEVPDPSSPASGNIGRYFDVLSTSPSPSTLTAVLFQEQVLSNFVEQGV